jgi:hypothetical protein
MRAFGTSLLHNAKMVLEYRYYWRQSPIFVDLLSRTGLGVAPPGSGATPFILRTYPASRIRLRDTYDRSVTIGTWFSVMPGQQMHNQSVNSSVPFATQLSIFVKG